MRRSGTLIAAVTLGILAPAAPAALAGQGAADLSAVCHAVGDAKLGQWASYDGSGSSGTGKLRLALVGSERAGDSTLYWFEVSFAGNDASHSGVVQLLTPSLTADASAPRAVIVKLGAQPPMKLSGQMAAMMDQKGTNTTAFDWARRCSEAHVVGWESVTVPAGTFRVLHVTTDDGDVWASRDVPFGFVKMHGRKGDLVLTGRGADAKSSITEKPMEMPNIISKP
jgi:hypothetical protein